ncbi:hypothetical protein FO519_006717 [Halicephalobus sp. NKZ332]|nr:hypothetical protein FO519_006717 [Halicephalobus sp. NKZ332]
MIIIILRIVVTFALFGYMTVGGYYINYWLDVVYEAVEFISVICLVVGYLKEESKWMILYMAVEFTWLVISLIIYIVSVSALFYPQNFYNWLISPKTSASSDVKSNAFEIAVGNLVYSLLLATEITILLACSRYFDDEKERIKETRERPIILNTNEETQNNTIVFMDDVTNSSLTNETPTTNSSKGTVQGLSNPNFTLENDSEDELDENNWHRTGKRTNVLK